MARNSVSLQDVAREAGVSPQTVSRVANGSDAVRPATKLKVEAAMEHLGYRPNYAARALKSGHFNNVGVLLSHMSAYGTHVSSKASLQRPRIAAIPSPFAPWITCRISHSPAH